MSDVYRVNLVRRAAEDLDSILAFISKDSPERAVAVVLKLRSEVERLDILPHRYKIHLYRNIEALTVRSMPVPPYVVYYRIDEDARVVNVLEIRHGRRRRPRQL